MRIRVVLGALVLVSGCGGGSRPDGQEGGRCRADGTCDPGLTCDDNRCVRSDGGGPLLDAPASPDVLVFVCSDDSAFEPNDSIATAFVTPIATQQSTTTIVELAICPGTDQDFYSVNLPSPATLVATVVFTQPAPLQVAIQNAGGTSLVTGAMVNSSTVAANAPNLPAGTYFVRVSGTSPNNYQLSLSAN